MAQIIPDELEVDYRRRPQASAKPFVIEARLKEEEREKRKDWAWNYRMEWTEVGRYASERDRQQALRAMVRKEPTCDFRTIDKGAV